MGDLPDVDAYLARFGASADMSIAELQRAHLLAVPFENLSIHLGEPISLEPDRLYDKLVTRRRGGFCYELNGLFGLLLLELGHPVELLAARVRSDAGWGPPLDHLVLRVRQTLVDVGFGAHSTFPLRLDTEDTQDDPGGSFRIRLAPHQEWEVSRDGRPAYLVSSRPYQLGDFAAMCWWQSHRPGLPFTTSLVCSRLTGRGRVTLSSRTLIETVDGDRAETPLGGDERVLAAYRHHFGITLDRVPEVAAGTS